MSVFAVYSDATENGQRVRHVHATCATFQAASSFVKEWTFAYGSLAVRRFEDAKEVKAFEIDPASRQKSEDDEWNRREEAWAKADHEADTR